MTPETIIAVAFAHAAQPRVDVIEQYHRQSGAVTPEVRSFEDYMFQVNSSDMSVTFGSDHLRKAGAQRPWLGEVIEALIADVPAEEWDKIPDDLASTVKTRLYGHT